MTTALDQASDELIRSRPLAYRHLGGFPVYVTYPSRSIPAASQRDRHLLRFTGHEGAFRGVLDYEPIGISNHRFEIIERFALTHHSRHLFNSTDKPTVISPVLERKLFHHSESNRR
jgi:hypothetical protein